MTENEQFLIVNDLLLDAHQAYIDWQKNFRVLQINQNAVNLNTERLKWIEKTSTVGRKTSHRHHRNQNTVAVLRIKS
jgi:hypothetical protein